MGIILLCGGLFLFAFLHLLTATKSIRTPLAKRFGEGPYKGVFALLSLVAFALAMHGYASMDYIEYWQPIRILVLVQTFVIMPVSVTLLVSSYVSRGTQRITRHPMLTGVALACFGHLLVNGDLAAIFLFGGLAIYCVVAMLWSDVQAKLSAEEKVQQFLAQTGYVPAFTRLRVTPQDLLPRLGVLGPAIGVVMYGLALTYHGQVFGVSPLSSIAS
ncbi:NnrU family protein [Kiloniella sp.]|uniref:NnrU family protein n=1 Tax=Kiloniella sp. TaxID=1938587 RepID=UPI003B02A3A9